MKKIYKSKIGLELVIFLVSVFGTVLAITVSQKPSWIGIVILLPVILFVVQMLMTTDYTIDSDKLTIKCGFLYNKSIDIKTITKIMETNNPLSSPAASLDRLEINYGKFESVLISPKQKSEFINDIKELNPSVEVKYKKK
ncbi:PH domain-containing protein [Flexibacter flexilis DSM 6793]|uniref:PH domain-containing protein n=1 Tax=Flexibacter flexilis DSM 6793 TaxID=927664 RepID=A0A1I1JFK1_9BACT|nr:PH domain-containing protein [Flexibacter flexilis]SFC44743.1 PH domain-containing protein [Flexibacter flexilis DSM 6793]